MYPNWEKNNAVAHGHVNNEAQIHAPVHKLQEVTKS